MEENERKFEEIRSKIVRDDNTPNTIFGMDIDKIKEENPGSTTIGELLGVEDEDLEKLRDRIDKIEDNNPGSPTADELEESDIVSKPSSTSKINTVNWQDASGTVQQKILDETDYSWEELSYDELMRYNEKYVGKNVRLRGEVIQVQNVFGDEYMALAYTTCETFIEFFCNADLVWINYSDVRMLNGDLITFWGEVKGQKSYVNGFGGSMTVPEVDASAIHITN